MWGKVAFTSNGNILNQKEVEYVRMMQAAMRTFIAEKQWDKNKYGSYTFKNFTTGGLTGEERLSGHKISKNISVDEVTRKVNIELKLRFKWDFVSPS